MSYEEALRFWFERINYEQKTPQIGDFKLDRMRRLLHILGDPHQRLRLVHITGSKGKGSTSAILAAILQAQGYRVGLFTSPHLVAVEERIQVDGEPISRLEIAWLLTEIRAEAGDAFCRELTFFEIGTALGFLHFLRRRTDFGILEVGLGGRFDSTNVCQPMLSIITSISFDHTQMLGNTLGKIAFEKAGIVKPWIPTISGVREGEHEASDVIAPICRERHSVLRQLGRDFEYVYLPARIAEVDEIPAAVEVNTPNRRWPRLHLGLIGEHQGHNAALAIMAVDALLVQGVPIGDAAVAKGLANVVWPARLEIMSRQPFVLLDCAHNVASARVLASAIRTSFPLPSPDARRLLIFAGNRDKDLAGMLAELVPFFDRIFLTSVQATARRATVEELLDLLQPDARGKAIACGDSADAWRQARTAASSDDLICATGSVFLAGELRPLMAQRE